MQISKTFDPVTVGKVKRSAFISLAGFAVVAIPMLLPDIMEMLKTHPMWAAFIGAGGPWLVNTVREWMRGQE